MGAAETYELAREDPVEVTVFNTLKKQINERGGTF